MSADALAQAIRRLAAHETLDGASLTSAFGVIMRGEATPAQIAAILMALRVKGESAAEVAGVVEAMREAMVVLPADAVEAEPNEFLGYLSLPGGCV